MRRMIKLLLIGAVSSVIICKADAQNSLGGLLNRLPGLSTKQPEALQQSGEPTPGQIGTAPSGLMAVVVNYGSDGTFQKSDAVHNLAKQEDCNTFVNQRIRIITAADAGKDKVSNSTLITLAGNSGYIWLGCIGESDYETPAYRKYVNTPMTKARADEMTRFPMLNYQEPSGSQRGKKIRM
jgi:hypothetical protein